MWGDGKKQEGQEDTGKEQRERSRGGHGLLAIKLLDAPAVIIRQHKVLGVHPLVKGRHDGRGITGMLEAQGMAQLMHGHQKDVIPWREERAYDGGRDPFPQAPSFPIRGFSFTPKPACCFPLRKATKPPCSSGRR